MEQMLKEIREAKTSPNMSFNIMLRYQMFQKFNLLENESKNAY